jgi:CheY-like chemotaxis protein
MTRLLQHRGYAVATAADCASALERAKQERFDLLVTDVGLPDGMGLELLASIRRLYSVAGIVVSGYGTAADVSKSEAAGFARHLTKPIDGVELFSAIDDVMELRRVARRHETNEP